MSNPVSSSSSPSAKPIGVGICGFGRSGCGIHAKAIARMGGQFAIKAVFDPIETRRGDYTTLPSEVAAGIRPAASFEELLANPDVELVIVASPNLWHARQARQALAAGKHVLCEKPFGFTTADVDAMIAAAKAAGRVLQPFQQRRFEQDFQKVREVCASGRLGRITHVRTAWHGFSRRWDWQTLRKFGGGQLYNNGPHPLDHALELFGPGEPDVWCDLRRSLASGDAEDEVRIILRGKPGTDSANAPVIQIELLATAAYPDDRWLVCGTAGGLRGNGSRLDWKWVDWTKMPARPVDERPTPDRSYNSEPLEWETASWEPAVKADAGAGAPPAEQPVADMYGTLWATIREGAPQFITPEAVRRRVAVLEKCYRQCGVPFPEGTLGA
ncbi:Gfo/Idh/MocA family protein [Geminisphaera colitermitum]|uniref:Gfo/Idh/MocA family protein n=1 Tax=Geminisphaera colitermitum TaxID=1148786 RepID=UPI000158D4CA|nr:Gfo/Idh/MocA family oxidoreductase [Geminisphaera colitermitum]